MPTLQDGSEQVEATGIRERNPVDFANLRVLQQNFIQLSVAADHKANIVIAATLVMLSLLVSNMHSGRMPMVGYVMGGFLLLACLFALLGVVPRITLHRDGKDGQARMANPFFFGDLDKISAEDYLSALAEVLAEDADLFKTMALDVY